MIRLRAREWSLSLQAHRAACALSCARPDCGHEDGRAVTQAGPANGAPTVWTLLALFLALAGPLLVAMFSNQIATSPEALTPRAFSLLLFVLMLLAIVVIATKRECLLLKDLGFRRSSWRSLIWAAPIIAFFVFIFGPVAYAALDVLNLGSFDAGRQMLETLPRWYLALAIIVVAGGEEWLYRGYVIERLERFTGSAWIAGALSLSAFFFAHLPLWGPGPALTTLASGAVLTLLYLWRRDVLMLMVAHVATDLIGLM